MKKICITLMVLFFACAQQIEAQEAHQLDELVIIDGKKKHKKMFGTGVKIPCAVASLTPDKRGYEVGSTIKTKHPFEVEEINFDITSNSIGDVTLGIEIYNISNNFSRTLQEPLLIKVPVGKKQEISVQPEKRTIIEPGEYFVAIKFIDCVENREKEHSENSGKKNEREALLFPLYLKNSYIRHSSNDSIERCKINMGLKIRGIEYK